jgi:tetratricopeptide (TPR) repeat protein
MVKVYKRLARLHYNSTYYQQIITYTSENNRTRWTLAWLSAAIDNEDWSSAEEAATNALKLTNEPIPILCQLVTVYTHWQKNKLNHTLHRLGIEYFVTNQIDLAEKTYRKAYERLQSEENALALGEILNKQNKIPESVQMYYEAINLALRNDNPENLQLCLKKIYLIDPDLIHLTQDQKDLVLNQSQKLKFSIELELSQDKLAQPKKFIESQISHPEQSSTDSKTRVYNLNS